MIAYVQVLDGLPATDGCYVAWRGLEERGWEVRPFAHSGEIDVSPAHPVIGGIGSVVGALRQLGIVPPDIDYPESLREYCLDPSVGLRTMGWVRRTPAAWPTFVKPTTGRKEFVGMTVRTTADLLRVTQVDDDLPVFESLAPPT